MAGCISEMEPGQVGWRWSEFELVKVRDVRPDTQKAWERHYRQTVYRYDRLIPVAILLDIRSSVVGRILPNCQMAWQNGKQTGNMWRCLAEFSRIAPEIEHLHYFAWTFHQWVDFVALLWALQASILILYESHPEIEILAQVLDIITKTSAIFCHILPSFCPAILPFCLAVQAQNNSAPTLDIPLANDKWMVAKEKTKNLASTMQRGWEWPL
ncbi:hypothetical protein B0H13DRAFT_1879072 [Mycena leptocephala]|nr:hypothetical protein B0H13DRAFT_1879072 [Mycena leptocephala]